MKANLPVGTEADLPAEAEKKKNEKNDYQYVKIKSKTETRQIKANIKGEF